MISVLEVNVDDNNYGGVYSFVKNINKYVDENQISINVCAFENFEKENNKAFVNGVVYECSANGNFVLKQLKSSIKYFKLLKRKRFDVIHIHCDVAYKLFLYGGVARLAGNKNIIVHSHSTGVEGRYKLLKKILQFIFKFFLSKTNYTKVACSKLAASWMYDKINAQKTIVLKNGIELSRFRLNNDIRRECRRRLGVSSEKIIGTVARFSYQKYPEKLLEVFRELMKINSDCKLLWVGIGDLKSGIEKKAKEYGIYDKIIFYGATNEVDKLYQAMDLFILTSRFEGLSIAAVEAQSAGLPCLCSAEMSIETRLYDGYRALSIYESSEKWASEAYDMLRLPRIDTYEEIKKAGYDLKETVNCIENLYKVSVLDRKLLE